MDRLVRIAAVGPLDERLIGELRSLPLRPDVRTFLTLIQDGEAISRFQPDLIVIAFGEEAAEEVGALRVLRQLWPALGALLVATPPTELAMTPVALRLRAPLHVHSDRPGQLAAAVEQALLGSERPRADVFVDLAHGIADEINNPLLFASGHLQLLRASFAAASERDRRDQVAAAMQGIARIQAAVDRLRLLTQAANGPRRREVVDLAPLLQQEVAGRAVGEQPTAHVGIAAAELVVHGEREHLAAAMAALVRFCDELAGAGALTALHAERLPGAIGLRVESRGACLAGWQLPQSFEPFYPVRVLRGQSQGLGLFLVQTVVLGHGGQARAQRQSDGSLRFDFVLPAPSD